MLEILIIWLKWSQSQSIRQDWASFDWKAYFVTNPPRFLDKSKVKGQDLSILLSEAWHPIRGLVWLTVLSSNCKDLGEPVTSLISELHCILLENFAIPVTRPKHGRNSSGVASDVFSIMWCLKFPSEMDPLLRRFGSSKTKCSELCLVRMCELISVCWRNGRLLECDLGRFFACLFYAIPKPLIDFFILFLIIGDVSGALRPFSTEKIVQVVQQSLRI